jgi:hypothetical protein
MKKIFALLLLVSGLALINSCKKKNEYKNMDCASNLSYTSSIRPIIDANCTSSGCHGSRSANGDYTTYDGLLIRVKNGSLSEKVLYNKDMPKGNPLSLDDRKKIKCWIDNGAPKD